MRTDFTKYVRKSGCASKMSPGDLAGILCGIEIPRDSDTLVGIEGFEDAGVYRIADDLALVQTIDFLTPVVKDPYLFGQIAAANALSDIYAMGAVPKIALNIVCFSMSHFDGKVLREILRGGADKLRKAGVSLLGGHSVDDPETKYGLSVTGLVRPDAIVLNRGAQPGDYLILTKPLGNGIISTGIREGMVDETSVQDMFTVMTDLNEKASEVMLTSGVHAATDVTGFGLIGHLKEMIQEDVAVELFGDALPYFKETIRLASAGIVPGGLLRNKDFYCRHVTGRGCDPVGDIIYDPQTSGGLLMAIDPCNMHDFERSAVAKDISFWIVGKFMEEPKGGIILR